MPTAPYNSDFDITVHALRCHCAVCTAPVHQCMAMKHRVACAFVLLKHFAVCGCVLYTSCNSPLGLNLLCNACTAFEWAVLALHYNCIALHCNLHRVQFVLHYFLLRAMQLLKAVSLYWRNCYLTLLLNLNIGQLDVISIYIRCIYLIIIFIIDVTFVPFQFYW